MRVAALGRTQFLYDTIRALQAHGHEIAVIGTSPAAPEYTRTEADFARLAQELGCPYFCQTRLLDPHCLALLTQANAEIAVSTNWQTLIPRRVLSMFPRGVLNAHMGDLPRYRGNACPNWAILNGESEVVLTIHLMAEDLDAGPIVTQRRLPISNQTYIGDIYRFADVAVAELFVEAVTGLQTGLLTPRPQPADPALSLRCFPRLPADGWLDWRQPADRLARIVRATAEPLAGAFTLLDDQRLTVWRACPDRLPYPWCGTPGQVAQVDAKSGSVAVLSGDGVLCLQEVSINDGQRQRANEVLPSIRLRLGGDLVEQIMRLTKRVRELEANAASAASRRQSA